MEVGGGVLGIGLTGALSGSLVRILVGGANLVREGIGVLR